MSSEGSSNDSFVDVAMEDIEGYKQPEVGVRDDPTTALELTVVPRHDTIGIDKQDVESVQICSTVTASSNLIKSEDQRAPVDIAVALDVSGSMNGAKLNLCKATIELLIRELRPCDRFGLVTFANDARVEIPTRKLTQQSKQAALDKVKRLHTRGCTNLSGGISLAIQDMKAVESPNEIRSVFVLTDGMANRGVSDSNGIVDLTKGCLGSETSLISISTFGYGSNHNAKLLGELSQITQGGSYYFLQTDSDVASAFGDCLGGILSVVAQNTVLTIGIPPEAAALGVKITKVYSDDAFAKADGSYTVSLGDFYAEESRDVLFEVSCAAASNGTSPIPHARCSISSYVDVIQKRIVDTSSPAVASIARPLGDEVAAPNARVTTQWLRIRAANAMKRANSLSRAGRLEAARAEIRTCLDEIRREDGEGVRSDPLAAQLVGDLDESLLGLADRRTWRASGEMRMQTKMYSHARQRCCESSVSTQTNVYAGASKKMRSLHFSSVAGPKK